MRNLSDLEKDRLNTGLQQTYPTPADQPGAMQDLLDRLDQKLRPRPTPSDRERNHVRTPVSRLDP